MEFSFDRVELTLISIFIVSFIVFTMERKILGFFFIYLHKILKYLQF